MIVAKELKGTFGGGDGERRKVRNLPFFVPSFLRVFRKLDLALQDIVALRREHEQKVHNAVNLGPWTGQIAFCTQERD